MARPPTIADLRWERDLVFHATSGSGVMTLDGGSQAGLSPVQTLAIALAGCMSADVAFVLTRGRHIFRALTTHFEGERAPDDPHRFVRVAMRFAVTGDVPPDAVARAIELSREKYCSVWHSMRQDIELTTAFEVRP